MIFIIFYISPLEIYIFLLNLYKYSTHRISRVVNKLLEKRKMENVSFKNAKIVKSPKDTVLDGVITNMKTVTWNELLENVSQEKRDKFEDLNAKRYLFEFEVLYEGRHIKGNTHVAHYPMNEIPDSSHLGKIIEKYGEDMTAGTKIRVDFNEKGTASLRF